MKFTNLSQASVASFLLLIFASTAYSQAQPTPRCFARGANISFSEDRARIPGERDRYLGTYNLTYPSNCDVLKPSNGWHAQAHLYNEAGESFSGNFFTSSYSRRPHSGKKMEEGYGTFAIKDTNQKVLDGTYYIVARMQYSVIMDDGSTIRVDKNVRSPAIRIGAAANPTPNPIRPPRATPTPIPDRAPSINVSGLPADTDKVTGMLNMIVTIQDDNQVASIDILGFNQKIATVINHGQKSYSKQFTIDTSLYPDGNYTMSVTATDSRAQTSTFNEIITLTNHGGKGVEPQPAQPQPPVEQPDNPAPPIEGGSNIGALMNLLVQLLAQLMEAISNLNTPAEPAVITRSLSSNTQAANTAELFHQLVKTNKSELRSMKQTKRIPRLSKRFSQTLKKALKAKRAKRRGRMKKKADRQLQRILKNLQ